MLDVPRISYVILNFALSPHGAKEGFVLFRIERTSDIGSVAI
jgi:hypothetical protein